MENKPKRFVAPLLGLAAIGVVVVIYMMATTASKDVDLPAKDATPEQVASAYMRALDSHDCNTAEALATPSQRVRTQTWCRKVGHIADQHTSGHIVEPSQLHEANSLSSTGEPTAAPEVVRVPVTFELTWRVLRSDVSMPEGPTDWAYFLTRESPTEPWRVFDEGNA